MPRLVCDCGAEVTMNERDLRAMSGKPFTCTSCGKTRKLPLQNVLTSAASPQIACPHCNSMMEDDESLSGQVAVCPTCGAQFQMPGISKPRKVGRPLTASSIRANVPPGKVTAIRIMLFVGAAI